MGRCRYDYDRGVAFNPDSAVGVQGPIGGGRSVTRASQPGFHLQSSLPLSDKTDRMVRVPGQGGAGL
jgi:hypothetical protein